MDDLPGDIVAKLIEGIDVAWTALSDDVRYIVRAVIVEWLKYMLAQGREVAEALVPTGTGSGTWGFAGTAVGHAPAV